jgi:hypothetical protein
MSVIYTTAAKAARMGAVVTAIGSGGKIKFFTAGDVLLASFTLASTPATVSGAVLTFSDANGGAAGILNTVGVAAGAAAKASVTTSADVDVITGLTVGTTGTDFIIDNTSIAVDQAVTINSATITHA